MKSKRWLCDVGGWRRGGGGGGKSQDSLAQTSKPITAINSTSKPKTMSSPFHLTKWFQVVWNSFKIVEEVQEMRHLLILGLLALTKAKDILIHSKIDQTVETETKDIIGKDGSTRKTEALEDKGRMSELKRSWPITLMFSIPTQNIYSIYIPGGLFYWPCPFSCWKGKQQGTN